MEGREEREGLFIGRSSTSTRLVAGRLWKRDTLMASVLVIPGADSVTSVKESRAPLYCSSSFSLVLSLPSATLLKKVK